MSEPARIVLARQLAIDGPALPSKSPLLFVREMLAKASDSYKKAPSKVPVFFDRGIPDLIAYAIRFEVDSSEFERAAKLFSYNPTVFLFPPWKEIFVNDNERKISFENSLIFHQTLVERYQKLNYDLVEVPFSSIAERAQFIVART